ncbi:hypothetical protein [Streptomyces sp. NPDC000410]|uniref:hypothetical protein n=1 Tax=Streptomyces sp. NPDC000410 TaxID=3154254 RepID=UPI00332934CF
MRIPTAAVAALLVFVTVAACDAAPTTPSPRPATWDRSAARDGQAFARVCADVLAKVRPGGMVQSSSPVHAGDLVEEAGQHGGHGKPWDTLPPDSFLALCSIGGPPDLDATAPATARCPTGMVPVIGPGPAENYVADRNGTITPYPYPIPGRDPLPPCMAEVTTSGD